MNRAGNGLKTAWGQTSDFVKGAVITGVLTIIGLSIAAVITGLFGSTSHGASPSGPAAVVPLTVPVTRAGGITSPSVPATTSAPRVAVSSPTTGCTSLLRVVAPVDGQSVVGSRGVLIKGSACGLSDETVWLFEYDTEDHYYWPIYDGNTLGPAITRNGAWAILDQPIGDPGDSNKAYVLRAVLANRVCQQALATAPPIDGDQKYAAFPGSCSVLPQAVTIYVTY